MPQLPRALAAAQEVRRPDAEQAALDTSRTRYLSVGQPLPYVVDIAAHPAIHADTRRTLLDSDHR